MNLDGEITIAPINRRESLLTDSVALFSGLNPSDLDGLLTLSKTSVIKSRQVVCGRGEPGDALYVLIAGKLKVTAESGDGRELILAILDAGETFGEMSLLDGKPRCANVIAVQDSELLVIRRQDFLLFLEQHPKVAIELLAILTQRLRGMDDMMGDVRFLDVRRRLARMLHRLVMQHGRTVHGGGARIDLQLSQEDLGNLICATRESVNKHLKAWEEEGWLSVSQNGLVIYRLDILEAAATEP
jgi:CRP-like cAMP-binding protein